MAGPITPRSGPGELRFHRFNGHELIARTVFTDGERITDQDNNNSIDEKVAV